jgi:dienelactone hydrolase
MKQFYLLLTLVIFSQLGTAQPYQIGHTTITFNDAARTGGFGSGGGPGRQIQCEIYYPASIAGEDVAVNNGDFPVVVFGHGFVMTWDAYQNIWDELVPQGYIVVFPRTEGGFSPSHDEFGLDLSLCVAEMQNENNDGSSLFFNHVTGKSAIMGHSMGSGASFLAAENNTSIETVIGLAPAETTPSAITAASQVSVDALVLSGSSDGVTPPADHHLPIYYGLNVACKHFISVTGGAHCYFANANFNCDFGEATASTGITITRTDQQQVLNDYVTEWLDYKLNDNCTAFTNFQSLLTSDTRVTYLDSCNINIPVINTAVTQNGNMLTASATGVSYQWIDCNIGNHIVGEVNQSFTATTNGNYAAIITENGCSDTTACFTIVTTGVDETGLQSEVSIFPNPTAGNINIGIAFITEKITVRISNSLGKIVQHAEFYGQQQMELSLKDVSKGMYFLTITDGTRNAFFRVVKE